MKNLTLIFLFSFMYATSFGQNAVYVIFTSSSEDGNKAIVMHLKSNDNHVVAIQNRSLGYVYDFLYFSSDESISEKPVSFLDTLSYIDWDRIGPGLNKQQAAERIRDILSHDKIYFIDRNDIKNGIAYLIPVKRMESAF